MNLPYLPVYLFNLNEFHSLNYEVVYTSEVFEDATDVFPSLLAKIHTSEGMDSKLRFNVYYSSSLTSGKDILLASTTILERELIRVVSTSEVMVVDMESEYCTAPKAYIDIVTSLPQLLENRIFPIISAPNEKNPLTQNYVFYNELDTLTPAVDAKEQCWEPKFSASIPLLFLANLSNALERSTTAWEKRFELERKRQGRFTLDSEALNCGWHVVDIVIHGARIGSTKATIDRINYMKGLSSTVAVGAASSSSATAASNDNKTNYVLSLPISEDFPDIPSPVPSTTTPSMTRENSRATRRTHMGSGFTKLLGGSLVKKVDDSTPSTYVEVFIEDK